MAKTITEEKRYYLCSKVLDVKSFAKAVRGHWGVENSYHWVFDAIFKEDE
jgi:predicted transposase YbfD/YdcC